nr:uncharacterized protein LOC111507765 [Leptinotarsa decemlineata]
MKVLFVELIASSIVIMKSVVLLCTILAAVSAQRPSFAGSRPIGVPDVASRFKDTESSGSAGTQLPNRFNTGAETTSSSLPIERQWQQYWPRENQPFSVVNEEHIRRQLYPTGAKRISAQDVSTNSLGQNPTVNNRGSFNVANEDSPDKFTVFKNNQLVTYVHDPLSDTWYSRKN